MSAKILKVVSNAINYSELSKKYGCELTTVVPVIILSIEIKDWPNILISAFRYAIFKLLPTTRFEIDINDIDTNDKNFLHEKFMNNIRSLIINNDCPKNKYSINITNKQDTYCYINTNEIKIDGCDAKKYINCLDIYPLKSGKYLRCTGQIVQENAIKANSVFHNSILCFMRDLKETKGDVVILNSGTLTIKYQDNRSNIVNEAINALIDILNSLLDFDSCLLFEVGKYMLVIELDRSSIIANLIFTYLEMHYVSIKVFTLKCDIKTYGDNASIILFNEVPDLVTNLKTTLTNLISALQSLH